MNLTKSKIDAFRYEGQRIENKKGETRWTRDVRWDDKVPGLGVRITPSNRRSFVLSYRVNGTKRLITLGDYGTLTLDQARDKAIREKGRVIDGQDPLEARQDARDAPTMADLERDYLERHAEKHKRPDGVIIDRAALKNIIRPALGSKRVEAVRRRDIERLHQRLKATPYRANRVLALLSKMFSLAVQWDWRADNPCRGIQKFHEEKRERWLKTDELRRLTDALDQSTNRRASDAVRMLILTGARKGEVLKAEWSQIDFERGVWTKPSAHTKQKRTEHVPLSAAALALLLGMRERDPAGRYLFPGDKPGAPLQDIKRFWAQICREAKLKTVRIHDLRHTFASHLVSSGMSLELVGRLLGHTQAATTMRYAHLADDPLREAANRFGNIVTGDKTAEVVPLRRGQE
jgi:integrase